MSYNRRKNKLKNEEYWFSLTRSSSEQNMIALHKYLQMNTGEQGELFKLKDIGI